MEYPSTMRNGTINVNAQKNDTLPKLLCQKWGATSGKTAIDNKIPANGIVHKIDNVVPSTCGMEWTSCPLDAKTIFAVKTIIDIMLIRNIFII